MSVYQNINGTLTRMDASDLVQIAAVDTEGILGGTPGATTDGQTLVDRLAADDVQAQTDIGQIKTDLSDEVETRAALGAHNVCPNNATDVTKNNVAFTVLSDKKIQAVVNSTTSGYTQVVLNSDIMSSLLPDVPYILSGAPVKPAGASYRNYRLTIRRTSDTTIIATTEGNETSGAQFIITTAMAQGDTYYWELGIFENTTAQTIVFEPMIRLASDTDHTYAPYAMTNRELTENNIANPTRLTSSDNLNNVSAAGFYYWETSAPTNSPESKTYCTMHVERCVGIIKQIAFWSKTMYVREYAGNPMAWKAWDKFTGTTLS